MLICKALFAKKDNNMNMNNNILVTIIVLKLTVGSQIVRIPPSEPAQTFPSIKCKEFNRP